MDGFCIKSKFGLNNSKAALRCSLFHYLDNCIYWL